MNVPWSTSQKKILFQLSIRTSRYKANKDDNWKPVSNSGH